MLIRICMYVCMYVCICMYIYIYIVYLSSHPMLGGAVWISLDPKSRQATENNTSNIYIYTHTYIHTYIHTYTY